MTAYWEALEHLQPMFVIEACEYAAKGKVGDGRFLPTAAELFQTAEAFAAREAQRRKPHGLLQTYETKNDPATRQRIIDGFAKLLKDLRSGVPIDPDKATKDVFQPNQNDGPYPKHSSPEWRDFRDSKR